jgi:hypothetical protein
MKCLALALALASVSTFALMARGIFIGIIGIVAVLVLGPLGFNSMAWAQTPCR